MFILRAAKESDLDDLFHLSQLVQFINLPPDRDEIEKIINSSVKSFKESDQDKSKNFYVFSLVDLEKNKVIGVSMIHGQHGTDESPHFFFRVSQEQKFSKTINTGFIHSVLQLDFECNGLTEIGGLVIHPDYRGNPHKLGKQLSFVRFLFMAFHKDLFHQTIHCELMPPLDKYGNSPLWEAIGRKFTNMEYFEADKLSCVNKEFILSLFPKERIYESMLPIEARNAIGEVGEETRPVRKMLESIGFKYINEVDPFDGGPHYRSDLDNILPIKTSFEANLSNGEFDQDKSRSYLIRLCNKEDFFAFQAQAIKIDNKIILSKDVTKALDLNENDPVQVIQL